MNGLIRYRDFYDFVMIIKKLKLDLAEIIDLAGQKEVRQTISPQNIISNWELANLDKQEDLQNIYYREGLEDTDIKEELEKLKFDAIKEQRGKMPL
jgi:hypothetical protein